MSEQQSAVEKSINDVLNVDSVFRQQTESFPNMSNSLKRPQSAPLFNEESVNAAESSRKVSNNKSRDMKPIKKIRRSSDSDAAENKSIVETNSELVADNNEIISGSESDGLGSLAGDTVELVDDESALPDLLCDVPDLIDAEDDSLSVPSLGGDIGVISEETIQESVMEVTVDGEGSVIANAADTAAVASSSDLIERSSEEIRPLLRSLLADETSSEHSVSSTSFSGNSYNMTSSEGMSFTPMDESGAEDSHDGLDESDSDDNETSNPAGGSSRTPDLNTVLNEILNKPKSCYSFNLTSQLMRREHGFSGNSCYSMRNGLTNSFNMGFYSSRFVVERMKVSHELHKHSGCVNSLNFSRDGSLLCSGSDDTRIVVWDWAKNTPKYCFKSGHSQNIFQTKFVNTCGSLDIISSSLDGEVRRSIVTPGGGKPNISTLYKHTEPVHKIVVSPHNPNEIISAGEDGGLLHKDLRSHDVSKLVTVTTRLYSVSHHPYAPQVCISGTSNSVRVYDKRMFDKVVHELYPQHLKERRCKIITCSVYDSSGDEILASYGDDNIYLFNNKNYVPGEYLHCYQGHLNQQTIKGVNFFGPHSEYIISGSDCGHIFFWDKQTEAILNYLKGDSGVVNCLEPQISMPILAVSGLDSTVKVATPTNPNHPPDLSKLETVVRRNLRQNTIGSIPGSESRFFSLIMRQLLDRRNFMGSDTEDGAEDNYRWNILPSSSNSSSSSEDDRDEAPMETFQCRTQ